jgi:hypothetical protein
MAMTQQPVRTQFEYVLGHAAMHPREGHALLLNLHRLWLKRRRRPKPAAGRKSARSESP